MRKEAEKQGEYIPQNEFWGICVPNLESPPTEEGTLELMQSILAGKAPTERVVQRSMTKKGSYVVDGCLSDPTAFGQVLALLVGSNEADDAELPTEWRLHDNLLGCAPCKDTRPVYERVVVAMERV